VVIKAIFFDFDGTISDAKFVALRSITKTLNEFGYEFNDKRIMNLLGVKMERMLELLGLDRLNIGRVKNKFYKYFTFAVLMNGVKPCVSLKPLWMIKKKDKLPLFIISNSKSSFLQISIRKLKIEGLFKKIYGAEKFDLKDEMLRILFKRMRIKPSEAVYVGDRFSDVRFAKKAGCVSVAIHNRCSWSSLEKIEKEKPDYIINDFYGLRKILKKLNKN